MAGKYSSCMFEFYREDSLASLSPWPFLSGARGNSPFSHNPLSLEELKITTIITALVYLPANDNFLILPTVFYLS